MSAQSAFAGEFIPRLRDLQSEPDLRSGIQAESIDIEQLILVDVKPPGDAEWKFTLMKGVGLRDPRGR
jgi:hypothetical protein